MTGGERYAEIITILAGAIVRHKIYLHNQLNRVENERSLTGVTMVAYAMVLFCLSFEKDLLLLAQDNTLGRKLQDIGLAVPKKRVAKKQ